MQVESRRPIGPTIRWPVLAAKLMSKRTRIAHTALHTTSHALKGRNRLARRRRLRQLSSNIDATQCAKLVALGQLAQVSHRTNKN